MSPSKRRPLLILSTYFVLALLMTWPLARQLGTAIPGDSFDGWQNVWNLWWMRESWLVRHATPYFAPVLHSPTGADLRFQTMAPFNGLATLPVQLAFGLLPAYNTAVLFSFVAGGFGAYLLALYALRNWGRQGNKETRRPGRGVSPIVLYSSAFIAGLIYAFSPYHFAHLLGHLQLIALQWIPFYVLYLVRGLDRSTPHPPRSTVHPPPSFLRDGLKAGLFLVLVGLCDWYYVMYCLLFTGLAVLVWAIGRQLGRRGIGMIIVTGALFGVVLAPLLVPMIQAAQTQAGASLVRDTGESRLFSADLLGFFTPQVFHPLWGDWAAQRSSSFTATPSEYTVFAGFTVLVLAGTALLATRNPRRRSEAIPKQESAASASASAWFWVAAAVFFALLALGPVLKVNGRSDLLPGGGQIPLPYAVLYKIVPFIKLSRSISRFDVMVMLFLGVVAAFGVMGLSTWVAGRWGELRIGRLASRGLPWVVAGLVLFEFLPAPYPVSPPDTPAWYEQLAADPANEAVLNLPANYERPWYLLYQITHGKPLATGYITRDDPAVLRERAPVLSQFWFLGQDIHTQGFDLKTQGMQVLHDLLGVGWVVLDRYKMPGGPERDVTTDYAQQIFAGQAPIYEDDRLTVYRVVEPAERGPYLILAPGWAPRQSDEAGQVWRALPAGQPAGLEIVNPGGDPLELTIDVTAPAGGRLVLTGVAGEMLASWELSPEIATLRSGSLPSLAHSPGTLQLEYKGPADTRATVYKLAIAPLQ